MSTLAITKELNLEVEIAISRVTEAIKEAGFGILTRIDFDQKIKEKLNETLPKTVILGACNPRLAFEAYKQNTDTLLLIPCNIVIRETKPGHCLVEAMRPSAMMQQFLNLSEKDKVLSLEKELENALFKL